MADSTKELSIIITARDEATRTIEGIGASFGDLVKSAQTGSFVFLGALTVLGKGIVDVASNLEQAKVSFTVFEGSAGAASKTLKQLSDFAKVTPFTFPQVVEAGKQLMAFGVDANRLTDVLRTLGDISAGVGTDKLPLIIHAYGQVQAGTRLTGRELNEFVMSGVPLLQALVDQINKGGGAMVQTAVKTKGTAAEIANLNTHLAISKQRLTELTASHNVHKSTLMSAQLTVQGYEEKLAKATQTTGGFSAATKVTALQVKDMIEKNQISADMVDKALSSMTSSGGRFFNLMDKQSHTFSGTMSNISDQLTRVALNIAGISTQAEDFGTVIKGGAFDILEQGANAALNALNALEPQVKGIIDAFLQNQVAIGVVIGALVGGLLAAGVAIATIFAPVLALMALFGALGGAIAFVAMTWNQYYPLFLYAFTFLGTLIASVVVPAFLAWAGAAISSAIATVIALGPVLLIAAAVSAAVLALALAWKTNFLNIQGITKNFVDWLKANFQNVLLAMLDVITGGWVTKFNMMRQAVDAVVGAIRGLISAAQELASRAAKGLKIPGFQHGGFVQGSYSQAVPAILHGGERVVPRTGTDVNSGGAVGGGAVTINISGSFNLDSESRVQELANKISDVLGRQNELAGKGIGI